jgi:hypothetical protein
MGASPEIEGVVEALTPQGELHGWARAADGTPLGILVLRQGTVLAQGAPSVPRPDLGGPHGYVVPVSAPLQAIELLGGLAQVFAMRPGRPPHLLPVVGGLLTGTLHALLQESLPHLAADGAEALAQHLRSHPALAARFRQPQPTTPEAVATGAMLATLPPNPQRGAAGICQVGVPVGLVSPDGAVVAGHEGQLFLVGGSNGLAQQYRENEAGAGVQAVAAGWHRVLAARAAACAAAGRGFLQLLIPDKSSSLPQLFPREQGVPTPYWRALAARVAADAALPPRVMFLLPHMAALGPAAWPRTDTHLSARGCHAVLLAACAAMGLQPPFADACFDRTDISSGDVAGRHFPGVTLLEETFEPRAEQIASWPAPDLVEEVDPGRHLGRRMVWRTPAAPIRARIVVFGNSYFERGLAPRSISWWFARAFSEFHFCWLPELDEDYVRAVQPDWVVCQTVERFLPQVPAR